MWKITLLVIVVAMICNLLRKQLTNPLAKLPGPPRIAIIGSWLPFIRMSTRELFQVMVEYPKRYGQRYVLQVFNRFILNVYNVNDIEVVLSHSKNITKHRLYSFLEPWLGTGLLISTGKKWQMRRKILTPAFHVNVLKYFSKVMEEKSQNMVRNLKERINKGSEIIDVMQLTSDCALYIICETVMGTQLDTDKSTATLQYKQEIMSIGSIIIQRLTRQWLHINILFKMSSLGKQFAKSLVKVQSFADDVILRRKMDREKETEPLDVEDDSIGNKRRLALLDLLLEAEKKGEIDLEGIREEVNTFMFEGYDTTAMAVTFGLMLLADHEEVQERIFKECETIFGDSQRKISLQDQAEMKYLEAVIKETLRLYPTAPFIGRKITEEFVLEDGQVVPKGSDVLIHIYNLHRRADIYPDPEAFQPERFLGPQNRHPFAFVPFSAGPRNCIGRRFAMQEMKCILSHIVRNFKLAPVAAGTRPALIADLVLRPSEPIYVKFIPR